MSHRSRRGVLAAAMVLAACGSGDGDALTSGSTATSTTRRPVTTSSSTATASTPTTGASTTTDPQAAPVPGDAPPVTAAPPAAPPPPAPAPPADPPPADPRIAPVTAEALPSSWRPGCPVGPEDLRAVTVTHLGFDGADHRGVLIVHERWAVAVLGVFDQLRAIGFPIERVEPVDVYGGSDDASMAANNTSAFNCRPVTGGSGWSRHAYGTAIDLNPRQNPYVTRRGTVLPPEGAEYVDRSPRPGVINRGDGVVEAFEAIGWQWGGDWTDPVDYQHFDTRP